MAIEEARRNIVVSRRRLVEDRRGELKDRLLAEIEPGQIRKGVVKNIAEFGAFVDLGGIDGLLHVTDMSWGRVASPHEVVHIDQQLEVIVLKVDKEAGERRTRPGPRSRRRPAPGRGVAEKRTCRAAPSTPARSSTS